MDFQQELGVGRAFVFFLMFHEFFNSKIIGTTLYNSMSNEKEKMNRQVIFQVQPSLYDQFAKACEANYKKLSDVLRELMLEYTKKQESEND